MAQGFKYEDCLLKHYVRTHGWLPLCRERRRLVNNGLPSNKQRRIRYFTFCAVGAIDVLMLDIAKVLRQSQTGKFDTVVFFDRDLDAVNETQKRIPGAIGFPGAFTDVVLMPDPDENLVGETDFLAPLRNEEDELITRQRQLALAQRHSFIRQFPFDVINLDLEEFMFKPRDPFPGQVVNALRKIFQWQRHPLQMTPTKPTSLDGFSLMFTTQIGPPNISDEYAGMLKQYLDANLQADPALSEMMRNNTGTDDLSVLQSTKFADFFKLGLPKLLAGILLEEDWYIDPKHGVTTFQFSRNSRLGTYEMLHLVMQVKRQNPIRERRGPSLGPPVEAQAAYRTVTREIFKNGATYVTPDVADAAKLKPTLEQIRARRRQYYPEEQG